MFTGNEKIFTEHPVNMWESTKYLEILLFFFAKIKRNYYTIQCETPSIY